MINTVTDPNIMLQMFSLFAIDFDQFSFYSLNVY